VEEHEKLVQVHKPKNWQREVNRIISTGKWVKSMVYDLAGNRYTINLDDETITVEEL
jgi:hypothetical protein